MRLFLLLLAIVLITSGCGATKAVAPLPTATYGFSDFVSEATGFIGSTTGIIVTETDSVTDILWIGHAGTSRDVCGAEAGARACWVPGRSAILVDHGPNGRSIDGVSIDGQVRKTILTITDGTIHTPLVSADDSVFAYVWRPATKDTTFLVWTKGPLRRSIPIGPQTTDQEAVTMSPNGKVLFCTRPEGTLLIDLRDSASVAPWRYSAPEQSRVSGDDNLSHVLTNGNAARRSLVMWVLNADGIAVNGHDYFPGYSDVQAFSYQGVQWNGHVYTIARYPSTLQPHFASGKWAIYDATNNRWSMYTFGRFDWPTVN